MNSEAFKLARATMRLAVKDYGWSRRDVQRYYCPDGTTIPHKTYRAPLGRFEGQHWSIVHYYDAAMNGCTDEPLMNDETVAADLLPVEGCEREAFQLKPDTEFIALWYSDNGFVTMAELTAARYDELRAEFAET